MKIVKALILCAGIALLCVSCGTTKEAKAAVGDSYQAAEDSEAGEAISANKTKASSNQKQKKKNSFSLANLFSTKFFEYEQTEVFTSGTFGGIKQQNATLVYYPKTGKAGFGSPIMAAYYYVTFDEAARVKIGKAVDQYLNDFENKKLDRKSRKSFKSYGMIKSELYWGTIKSSSPNTAVDNMYIGYDFVGNSPYFTLFMYPTTNAMYTGADCNYPEKSIPLHYYFTKAQAKAFADLISSEKVAEAINKYEAETYGMPASLDDYSTDEYDAEDDSGEIIDGIETDGESDSLSDIEDVVDIEDAK